MLTTAMNEGDKQIAQICFVLKLLSVATHQMQHDLAFLRNLHPRPTLRSGSFTRMPSSEFAMAKPHPPSPPDAADGMVANAVAPPAPAADARSTSSTTAALIPARVAGDCGTEVSGDAGTGGGSGDALPAVSGELSGGYLTPAALPRALEKSVNAIVATHMELLRDDLPAFIEAAAARVLQRVQEDKRNTTEEELEGEIKRLQEELRTKRAKDSHKKLVKTKEEKMNRLSVLHGKHQHQQRRTALASVFPPTLHSQKDGTGPALWMNYHSAPIAPTQSTAMQGGSDVVVLNGSQQRGASGWTLPSDGNAAADLTLPSGTLRGGSPGASRLMQVDKKLEQLRKSLSKKRGI